MPRSRHGDAARGVPLASIIAAITALGALLLSGCDGASGVASQPTPSPSPAFFVEANAIYVADTANNRIVRIEPGSEDPSAWKTVGTPGNGIRQFNHPSSVRIGSDYRIYVADTGNNRIVRMDNIKGENWGELALGFNAPRDMVETGRYGIFIADTGNNRIVHYDNLSGAGEKFLTGAGSFGAFNAPWSIHYYAADVANGDTFDYLLIADRGNNRIVRTPADMSAVNQTRYGRADRQPGAAAGEFDHPASALGTVFYTLALDTGNNRIETIDKRGGATVDTSLGLSNPLAFSLNEINQTLIADTGNSRIVVGTHPIGSLGGGVFEFDHPEGIEFGKARVNRDTSHTPTSITATPDNITIAVGQSASVAAQARNDTGTLNTDPIDWNWNSDDSTIASVEGAVTTSLYRTDLKSMD